jgi:trk system potassium uptake protein
VTILRDGQVYTPTEEQPVETGDELLFVSSPESEAALQELLAPGTGQ